MRCLSWWNISLVLTLLWTIADGQFFGDRRWSSGGFRKKDRYRKAFSKKHHDSNLDKYLKKARNIRHYYVAAIEVDWDYAPAGNLLGQRSEE